MVTKAENKVTILSEALKEFLGDKMNLACLKFLGLFISALCKVQTICFEKPACGFDSDVQYESSLRRIQRFMSEYSLESDLVARFIFTLFHVMPKSGNSSMEARIDLLERFIRLFGSGRIEFIQADREFLRDRPFCIRLCLKCAFLKNDLHLNLISY